MKTKSKSKSKIVLEKVLYGALKAIHESGGSLERLKIRDWLKENIEFNEWELASPNKGKHPRWWIYINWNSVDLIKADFLEKNSGIWSITLKGVDALEKYSPEELFETATQAYREWKLNQSDDDEPEGISWTRKHILFAGLRCIEKSPGATIEASRLVVKLSSLLSEEVLEDLINFDSEWANNIGRRQFGKASLVGWLSRKSGTWTLTESGKQAIAVFDSPESLWDAWQTFRSTDNQNSKPTPYLGEVNNSGPLPQTLYNSQNLNVGQIISQVDSGTLALPDIQRPFVWKNSKVRDLLDSMFRGFPIGYFLTWRNPVETRTRGIGTEDKGSPIPHALVIDGQQRLTSLYAVLTGKPIQDSNFKERRIEISFHPIQGIFRVSDNATKKSPEWIQDVSKVFTNEQGSYSVLRQYLEQLETVRELEQEHKAAAEQNIQRLVNLKNTQLNILEIGQEADEEQVAEIFVRINSKGQNLKQSDFILTLLAVFWEKGREELENFARDCKLPSADTNTSPYNNLLQPGPDDLIRTVVILSHRRARLAGAYQILRGKDPSSGLVTTEAREANLLILGKAQQEVLGINNWHEFLKVLEYAGFRNSQMILSMNAALMSYALFLIGRRQFNLSVQDLRTLIGKWFFFINITGRYSGSGETVMEEDLHRIKDLEDGDAEGFKTALTQAMNSELTPDFWNISLPMRLKSSNVRSMYSFFASQCVLNAKALYSTLEVSLLLSPERRSSRKNLEVHHLFPKAWLKSNGVTIQREINQIANQTLVEWSDNSEIADNAPSQYAETYENKMPDSSRNITNKLHAMPDKWWDMDYEDFLEERRKLMAKVIKLAFEQMGK
jgi:hypothetical protein